MGFPDIQSTLVDLLEPYGETATQTPIDVADRLPFIVVFSPSGSRDRLQWIAHVEILVYSGKIREDGVAVAEAVDDFLTEKARFPLDRVSTVLAPQEVPWAGQGVRLWTSTYEVVCRRQRSS